MYKLLTIAALACLFVADANAQNEVTSRFDLGQRLEDEAYGAKIEVTSDTMLASAGTDAFRQAVETIKGYGEVVGESLCNTPGRPASVMFGLTANFEFVFGLDTGVEVTWEVDELCGRLGLAEGSEQVTP